MLIDRRIRRNSALGAILIACAGACSGAPEIASSSEVVTGTLVEYVGRDNDGATLVEHYLSTQGKRIRLIGDERVLRKVEPNSQVEVTGHPSPDRREFVVSALESAEVEGQISEALSSSAPPGSVAVFLIKDNTIAGDPYSKQAVRDTLFDAANSTNQYFREASYGEYGLSGDVFGWYGADMQSCNSGEWFIAAKAQAAAQDGFVTDNYRHAVALFERNGDDCFYAFASIGAPDGVGEVQSFIHNPNVFAHEIGHNLGLHHANGFICRNSTHEYVPYGLNCQSNEYLDPYDGMGFDGFYFHFNTYSKKLQGWLPASNTAVVSAPGVFQIVPQEQAASATQSLLIPIPGTGDQFHVEMRQRFGFDHEDRFDGAVLIRRVTQAGLGNVTHLLDLSPNGELGDASMQVGQTFSDPLSGISIGLVSRTPSLAVVDVGFGGPSCSDGLENGTETDVDCGGLCNPCAAGEGCSIHRDCSSVACSDGECVDSSGGLLGQYYTGTEFDQLLETHVDKVVDFDWGNSGPILSDQFSVRWVGKVIPPSTDTYTFHVDSDDGVRLWVDNQLLVDRWYDSVGSSEAVISLEGDQEYDIRLEYFENFGGAYARLLWSTSTQALDLIPPTALVPAASCTLETALDLGPHSTSITVPSDACVKVSAFPSWWQWTPGLVTLQSGFGSFPVPATWKDSCTQATGQVTFAQAWQSTPIGHHAAGCPALIQLNGSGAPLQLTWW